MAMQMPPISCCRLFKLAQEDALAAQVVKLRYFIGMTNDEIANALEVSPRSVDRHWAYARVWLKDAMKE